MNMKTEIIPLPGAVKMGNTWLIPKDAEKPKDGRRKDAKE